MGKHGDSQPDRVRSLKVICLRFVTQLPRPALTLFCRSRSFGFGLRRVFPAEMILNPLRRQAYEALLIRASPIALRAYPQAKATFLRIGFSKIHGRPIV